MNVAAVVALKSPTISLTLAGNMLALVLGTAACVLMEDNLILPLP